MILARHEKAETGDIPHGRERPDTISCPQLVRRCLNAPNVAGERTREHPTATGTFKVQLWDRNRFFFFLTKGIEGALVV